MSIPMQRYPIFDVASPLRDLVFYEVVDYNIKSNRDMEYGTPHHNTQAYPNHQLVYITPNDKEGKTYRFYYAANRDNQDDYNWQISDGSTLERTYIVPRSLYYGRSAAEATTSSIIPNEFTYPVVGTADIRFTKYSFVDDSVIRSDEQLDSIYVTVKRRFMENKEVDIVWSEEFDRYVKVTKEFIPASVNPEIPTFSAGEFIEIKQGNTFFDVKITSQIVDSTGEAQTLPYSKAVIPALKDFRFPSKLESVTLNYMWAYAASTGNTPSYSEEYYFNWKIVNARGGPYEAEITRHITADPIQITSAAENQVYAVPNTVRETIGVHYAWFNASTNGNNTSAVAREIEVPATIHSEININVNGVANTTAGRTYSFTTTLAETPGFDDFNTLITTANSKMVIGVETRKLPYNLYEVSVIRLKVSNIYL